MMPDDAEQAGDFCWAALVARVLHPVDVQIVEAFRWIGEPLSAGDLAQIFDEELPWILLGRHLRRLERLAAVELEETPTTRNIMDIRYRLVAPGSGNVR
jgi:hypothetical protein